MNATECVRESEILDEIAAGRWPLDAPADLTAHAASCPVCGDLALAASALHDDQAAATQASMALPSAGQVWWRAELRARHEAARLAQRPVLAVQVVAAVVVVAALVTGIRGIAPDVLAWFSRTASIARSGGDGTIDTVALAVVLAVGLTLVLGSLGVYMVVRADRQGGR